MSSGGLSTAASPAPGVTPKLESPQDAGHVVAIVVFALLDFLVTIFYAIRVYVKFLTSARTLVEDWTCFVAWLLIMTYSTSSYLMLRYGEGYHVWEVTSEDVVMFRKWLYATSLLYCPAAYFTKVTLLLLAARVFSIHQHVARGIYIFIAIFTLAFVPIQVLKTVACLPIKAYWDPDSTPSYHCLDMYELFIADTSVAMITDVVILILPMPVVWSMRLPLAKKMKIIFLLGTGGVAVASTMFRVYKLVGYRNSTDVTANVVALDLTGGVEVSIGMVCACLPAVNMLLERHARLAHSRPLSTTKACSPDRHTLTTRMTNYYHSYLRKLNLDSANKPDGDRGRAFLRHDMTGTGSRNFGRDGFQSAPPLALGSFPYQIQHVHFRDYQERGFSPRSKSADMVDRGRDHLSSRPNTWPNTCPNTWLNTRPKTMDGFATGTGQESPRSKNHLEALDNQSD